MAHSSTTRAMWQLVDFLATLTLPSLAAQINVLEPWQGLLRPRWFGADMSPTVSVLQVDVRELIAPNRLPLEVYPRGRDLVAAYPPSEGRNVQTQIYWRATEPDCGGKAAGVELILSAQTHLLDSRPQLNALSVLPAGNAYCLPSAGSSLQEVEFTRCSQIDFHSADSTLFLFRPAGLDFSYAEMVYPSDSAGATLERRGEDVLRLSHQLFTDRLEKGVIRRARLCGLFLEREGDAHCALEAYQSFLDAPLPLTA